MLRSACSSPPLLCGWPLSASRPNRVVRQHDYYRFEAALRGMCPVGGQPGGSKRLVKRRQMAWLPVVIPENSSLLMLLLVLGSPSSTRRCGVRPNCPAITVSSGSGCSGYTAQMTPIRRSSGGAITAIIDWLHYGGPALAPMHRSLIGSYTAIRDNCALAASSSKWPQITRTCSDMPSSIRS
jgi:hypothetical protein